MNKFYYGKKEADLMKGIAITMMFYHHLFGFDTWLSENITYSTINIFGFQLQYIIAYFCKICVGIYIFSSGYALYINKHKQSFHNTMKRILKFLINYWKIFFIFILFGLLFQESFPPLTRFIKELFGIETATGFNWNYFDGIHPVFAWYVSFYILFLLLSPFISKLCRFNIIIDNLILLLTFIIGYNVIINLSIINSNQTLVSILTSFVTWGHIGMVGYTFAKYDIFNKVHLFLSKYFNNIQFLIFSLLCIIFMICITNYNGYYLFSIVSIFSLFTPISIYLIVNTLNIININCLNTILSKLAHESTNMWFLHGLFFTPSKILQPVIYTFQYPILILIVSMYLCYGMSKVMNNISYKNLT